MSRRKPPVLTQDLSPLEDTIREHSASLGDDNNSTPTSRQLTDSRKSSMEQIITMLWGLIEFSKTFFKERLQKDRNISRNSDSLQTDEFDAIYSELYKVNDSRETEKIKRKKLEVELLEKVARISELEQELERVKSSDIQKVEQQLALERLIVQNLSQRLDEITAKNAQMKADTDLLKHGHLKSMNLLKNLLAEFVFLCLKLPFGPEEKSLHDAFEEFEQQIEDLVEDVKRCVSAALFVARDAETKKDLISEEEEHIDLSSMSDKDAKDEFARWRRRKERDIKTANKKIIDNLRRVREMSLKVKSTEERLQHVLAEKQLEKDDLLREISRLRRMLKERQLVWEEGHAQVAESMRSFVENLQKLGQDLFVEKEQLVERTTALTEENDDLKQENQKLKEHADELKTKASNEAKEAVKKHLNKLEISNDELTDENRRLQSIIDEMKGGGEEEIIRELQRDREAKAKEIQALQQENATLRAAAQAQRDQRFSLSQQGFMARNPFRSTGDDVVAQSLPYGGTAAATASSIDSGRGSSVSSWRLEPGPQSLASPRQFQDRQVIQCLKCSVQFPVAKIEDYERHIRECYNVKSK
ncbi:probable DNA double-strand break repair Rad50 ATPase [Oscarella lobularis]|uniref:probable DNA double-strand break repair Rad50 ATPase n=1 Tax=Oscarella lobularis TaxID=121494 RepID=UPI0033132908